MIYVVGTLPAFVPITLAGQTGAAAKPVPVSHCDVRMAPMSPGDLAFSHAEYGKAIELYRGEAKAGGAEGDRAHAAMIRSMLRGEQVQAADKDARGWAKQAPENTWGRVALGEVEWREGHTIEAINAMVETNQRDTCNAQIHADVATIMEFSGKHASANAQLTVARKLDPVDDAIESDWMRMQPRATQIAEVTRYLKESTYLTAEERKSWEKRKAYLENPPTDKCKLATPVDSTAIPFRAIQDGPRARTYWGLDVVFNGKARRLEIDAGAHGLILTRAAAAALHLVPEEKFMMSGIGDEGVVNSFVAKVASIKIGKLTFENCDVQVQTKDLEVSGSEDGLIGGDVFASFLLTLDFPGRMLKLDPLPAIPGADAATETLATGVQRSDAPVRDRYIDPTMKDWTKLYRAGHDLILPIRLNEGPYRLFIVDTGAETNLISPDAAREVGKVSSGSYDDIYGISGKVKKTYTTGALTLDFAGMRYPTQGMTAIDTSSVGKEAGVEISGFLGAPTLHQLTVQIDYRDDLMHFSFDPKRLRRCVEGVEMADCY